MLDFLNKYISELLVCSGNIIRLSDNWYFLCRCVVKSKISLMLLIIIQM